LVSVARSRYAIERLRRLLAPDERLAAERFHGAELQARYVVAHAALREILARYLSLPAPLLALARNTYGKPYLTEQPWLRFNLSHAGDLALVGVCARREIGIDLEQVRADLDVDALARHAFAPAEVAALTRLPPEQRTAAFYAAWTRKEAYVKARGLGLSLPLDSFAVSLSPGEQPALLWCAADPTAPARWAFRTLPLPPGYAGTLVVEGYPPQVRHWQWSLPESPAGTGG
jgi:4'-phosphopantetheinyl transferase